MGRGQGARPTLQFTPLPDVSTFAASVLTLPLVEGVLELSWDDNSATMRLYGLLHALLNTASILRSDLPDWLYGMEGLVVARANTPLFGHFKFSYTDDNTVPRVYYGHGASVFLLGAIASWAELNVFLKAAHTNNLF